MAKYKNYSSYQKNYEDDIHFPSHWVKKKLKWEILAKSGVDEKNLSGTYDLYGANGIIGKSSTCLQFKILPVVLIGRVGSAGALNYLDYEAGISDNALVVQNISYNAPRFDFYLLMSLKLDEIVSKNAQPLITASNIRDLYVYVPNDENERNDIANFLDHETAKIDTLISKQEKLIELLKEKRQAVISHAVTKGLNPNVPMKDSGVEWLGEVPEHWVITPIRNLTRSGNLLLQDGNHGELHPAANDYVEEGIPFLMANNIRAGKLLMGDVKRIPKHIADKLRIGFAKTGDMLLTHKGTVGEVAVIPPEIQEEYWMLTPQVTYYRWNNQKFFNKYFYYQFQSTSIQNQLEIIGGKQSTRAYVGLIAQGDLIVVIPPKNEQIEIATNIFDKDQSYQVMIEKAESAIQLMQERRTALISAAVTGKIDVRNWQYPNQNNNNNTELSA